MSTLDEVGGVVLDTTLLIGIYSSEDDTFSFLVLIRFLVWLFHSTRLLPSLLALDMYHRLLATIVVVSLSFFPPQSRADAPVTLGRDPALGKFRPCVRNCYWGGYGAVGDYVAQAIGCGNTYSNDCFCRIDLQGEAEAYVNSCVNNGCSGNEIDRSPALSFYTDYCTKNGYTRDTGASTTAFSEGELICST